MPLRADTFFKWGLFGAAALLLALVQGGLQRWVVVAGVFPFLYPCLVSIAGMYEGSISGTLFGLVVGVVCDLTLMPPLPCFYTLIFPLVGLLSALVSGSLIPSGFFCALVVTVLAFFLVDGFHLLVLLGKGENFWPLGLWLSLRELGYTLLLSPLVFLLLRWVHRRCAPEGPITGY